MAFFIGPMQKHLNGHKELTTSSAVKTLNPEKVYIALVQGNAKVDVLVSEGDYVKVGTKIAERNDHFYVPMFASVSGKVLGIEKRFHTSRKKVDHLVIENDKQYLLLEDLKTLDYEKATKEEIVDFIKGKGLVGCGGAGFPTYVKFNGVTTCDTLIINAVECEPYITADYRSIHNYLDEFLEGTKALFRASGAEICKVAVKVTKKEFIKELKVSLANVNGVEVFAVPDVYPMGWERTLIRELEKKRYDRLPIEAGCIVSNATTAIALGKAMKTGSPIVSKIVTVSGDGVVEPSNVETPVGTIAKEIIAACGGYAVEEVLLISGGPMMGAAQMNEDFTVAAQSNAYTVLKYVEQLETPCLRCGACVENCPAGLQPVNIMNANKSKDGALLNKLNYAACIECGLCTYVCPSKIEVTEHVRRAKRYMALQNKK